MIESGVEAVALIVPPCFLPEQASAAAEAGLHVYMAKPVAVDVPGCLRIEAAGKLATQKQRVFLVDYQMPTDPVNIQVAERIRKGEIGKIAKLATIGINGGRADPPKTATIESRLQHLVWDNDMAIGGSFIVSYDIHAIDAAVWLARPAARGGHAAPRASAGSTRTATATTSISVVYEYADGLIHEHSGMALPNARPRRTALHGLRPERATAWSTTGAAARLEHPRQEALASPRWWTSTRPARCGTSPRSTQDVTGRPIRESARSAGRWTAA